MTENDINNLIDMMTSTEKHRAFGVRDPIHLYFECGASSSLSLVLRRRAYTPQFYLIEEGIGV